MELQEGAPFWGNGILAPCTLRSNTKISEVYDQYLLCRLYSSIAPYVYIELPLWSSRIELHFLAMRFKLFSYSGPMTKISEVHDQYLLCCLHFII